MVLSSSPSTYQIDNSPYSVYECDVPTSVTYDRVIFHRKNDWNNDYRTIHINLTNNGRGYMYYPATFTTEINGVSYSFYNANFDDNYNGRGRGKLVQDYKTVMVNRVTI